MRYTNKFVEFLNGANTVKVSGIRDYDTLKSLLNKVGLDCFPALGHYYNLLTAAQRNHCDINGITVLVEYQPYKGLTFGYHSYEESEKWYGMKPWTVKELKEAVK